MLSRYNLPTGKTAQWYYENLLDNSKFDADRKSGAFGIRGILSWVESGHAMWEELQDDPMTIEFIKDIVRKAVENTSTEGWGKIPGNIKEEIDSFLTNKKPLIPWGKVFRDFCASATENVLGYTMSRASRRFGTRPGLRKIDLLRIAVIVDTSGSITENELGAFFNEVRWIWRNGAEVTIFEADARVQRTYRFRGRFTGKVEGRGGTCLAPALEEAERGRFDVAVYFTDFEAPALPRKYRIPVLWVLSDPPSEEYWPCRWGRTVKIEVA